MKKVKFCFEDGEKMEFDSFYVDAFSFGKGAISFVLPMEEDVIVLGYDEMPDGMIFTF